jgi:arylsulfatase A-like enzyme
VVLVSLDTLRSDRLGVYGAHRATSPTLDALAAEATLFETVIAPAPWTLPSHVSMMIGLHSCAHGIVGPGFGNRLPAGIIPLAERPREAFGEHGATGHGEDLHAEVLRVPLLIWAPGLVAAGARYRGGAFDEECTRQRTDLAAAGVSRQPPPAALPDPERARQLKALGYVE